MINLKNKSVPTLPCKKCDDVILSASEESHNIKSPCDSSDVVLRMTIQHRTGFTLAEVLITLVIIGVIAAITVPTLITKYQKEQTVTRLKKAYSALSQTTQRAIADNGPIKTWDTTSITPFANKYLFPYLSVSKCANGSCSYNKSYLNGADATNNFGEKVIALIDGTIIGLSMQKRTENDIEKAYVIVRVDINGKKKPNTFGKDLFRFEYLIHGTGADGKFLPEGFDQSRNYLLNGTTWGCCNKSASDRAGENCAAVIMKDGWLIKDDYPW